MSAFRRRTLTAVCLLSSIFGIVFATQASERDAQSVELTVYQMTESEWSNTLTSFKTLVAAEATTYCGSNLETCGLASTSGSLFTVTQIGVNEGPTIESKSLKVSIYIDFPTIHTVSSTSTTQFVVNSNAVERILTNIRGSLESALDHDITYIGEEFYGIDPDSDMNKIIIPLAFVVLFSIVGLALGLHMWNKRKEQAEKKKLLKEKRLKKSSRIRPVHTIENDKQTNNLYDSSQAEKGAAPKEPTPAPHILYEERVSPRSNALPPLPSLNEEKAKSAEEKERERKERRRRRREKKRQEKEAAGEEYKEGESESEKSRSESLGQTLVPVEDDGVEVKA